ncbi:LTA synthase family protein [Butyricimonas hominis]|uniref:Sulfatase-like hydrolase/transferase n=1 Tax=Butyricimonas hominis TaxID=2763032 RepID=A0ABR7CZ88_9BACT|nr:alkaline phosphatase family protein [Butyricimonas hominis]MBC5620983.1 sulfatase-like hydrolase/transferase [Butyricimonas hominis]
MVRFLLKYYVFWVVFSIAAKVIFLVYQWKETATLTGYDYVMLFTRGLRMDLSFGGYVMVLACVIMAIGVFLPPKWLKRVYSVITLILLAISSLIVVGDLELFKNWGYHMDATPLFYLKTPGEAMASTPTWLILALVLLCAVMVGVFYSLYRHWVANSLKPVREAAWKSVVYLLLGGLMIIPVRGGFNVAPMNVSFVFFNNKNMYANQAAVNPVWNFLYEVAHVNKIKSDFVFMPEDKARQLVDSVYTETGTFPSVLKTDKPNVVVLLLESFTLNAWDAMPNLQAVAKEGIFFSNIYATGNRSDRGILGVISGFPAHPQVSMLKYPNKTYLHPRFPLDFEANGYSTRFYYAGDLNFGGFRSYVTMSFQGSVTENDFSGEAIENRFKWGVHDGYMLERLYEDLRVAKTPFMYMAFTMSSHEPFVVPMKTKIPGSDTGSKFKNAIAYTDQCLGEFFEKCKKSGIWDNTLFVLIADHGTRHVGNLQPHAPETYRIPMIFTGGAMSVQDSVVNTLGSQTDMVATMLVQLGIDASAYHYSKNLLDPSAVPFAFYAFTNAAAVVTSNGAYIYDLKSKKDIGANTNPRDEALLKAYLQIIDQDFKERH